MDSTLTLPQAAPDVAAPGRIVSLQLSGSHAHGTATPTSDEDWRGVYILPNEDFLGMGFPKTTFKQEPDIVLWEVAQFARMLLKGNPNILGMLWTPDDCIFINDTPMASLRAIRESLITRHAVDAYIMWAVSEMGRALTPKQLSHVPRLMWEIQDAILYRRIPVRLQENRLRVVRAIKTGDIPMEQALAIARDLLTRVKQMADNPSLKLPEPPYEDVEAIVQAARRYYNVG